jgi:hypothetical protein
VTRTPRRPAARKPKAAPSKSRTRATKRSRKSAAALSRAAIEIKEIDAIRGQLARAAQSGQPPRWNADPEDVRRSVVKLVLTLVELIRQLLERQALRRMDAGTLTDEETEAVGLALMRLEETVREIGAQFDLRLEDLNLDLGPVGKLL